MQTVTALMCAACANEHYAHGYEIVKVDPHADRDARIARHALAVYKGVLHGLLPVDVPRPSVPLTDEELPI